MIVKTPYNSYKFRRLITASDHTPQSVSVQIDTSINTLLEDNSQLENVRDNKGVYSNNDEIYNLFQPSVVDRVLDPVEVKFQAKLNKDRDQNTPTLSADQTSALNTAISTQTPAE